MLKQKTFLLLVVVICLISIFISCSLDGSKDNHDRLFRQIGNDANWAVFKPNYRSRSLENIITYQANGLVTDYLDKVIVNDTILAVGSLEGGFSVINLDDINSPMGKVSSYIGLDSTDASDRFGFSGFAIHPINNKIYAWYGSEIVDVETMEPIFNSAPDFTHRHFGASPLNRFEIDNDGTFWIGTLNLDADGNRAGENGLHVITTEGARTRNGVINQPIWHLFKDSDSNIWVSAQKGLYKFTSKTTREMWLVADLENHYVEQTFEYKGDIYIVAKNFFHNANISTEFKLYKLDSSSNSFVFIDDITKDNETYFHQVRAFEFKGNLYFAVNGLMRYLNDTKKIVDAHIDGINGSQYGQYSQCVSGDTLYSVGNFEGVSIFDSSNHYILNQANTAEQLISDNIHVIYANNDNDKVFLGPELAGGFSYFKDNLFSTVPFSGEVVLSGFFEYQNQLYVQGTGTLGILSENEISKKTDFSTNGERITYDPSGYLWAFPNFSSYEPTGVIGMMDLENYRILRTKKPDGNDYWKYSGDRSAEDNRFWTLDQHYHFNDVKPIPDSTNVMIAVSAGTGDFATNPHTLQYSHENNEFTKIPTSSSNTEGIMMMATNNSTLYGVGRQQMYKLEDSQWVKLCSIHLGNDIRDLVVFDTYAIIASGWNKNGPGERGGIELVNLETLETQYYTANDIPLPSDAVFALSAQKIESGSWRLWFGTKDGLAYCDVSL